MKIKTMGLGIAFLLGFCAFAGIRVDSQTNKRIRITSNEITFNWSWDYPWVPANSQKVQIKAVGNFYSVTTNLSRSAGSSWTWKIVDNPDTILDDEIDVSLMFEIPDNLWIGCTANYEIRASSFKTGRIRGYETNSVNWASFELPCVFPYNVKWLPGEVSNKRTESITYMQWKNIQTGKLIGPPWRRDAAEGFYTITNGYLPRGKYVCSIHHNNERLFEKIVSLPSGSLILIR